MNYLGFVLFGLSKTQSFWHAVLLTVKRYSLPIVVIPIVWDNSEEGLYQGIGGYIQGLDILTNIYTH